MDEIMVMLEF